MHHFRNLSIDIDFKKGSLLGLRLFGEELLLQETPLFRVQVRKKSGERALLLPKDAHGLDCLENRGRFWGFEGFALSVELSLDEQGGEAAWHLSAAPQEPDLLIEWIDAPLLDLPSLKARGAKLLIPYNEGALVEDESLRQKRREPEYPSLGADFIFPNMLSSQMMAYLAGKQGLYIGAHDPSRGVKGLDFEPIRGGIELRLRLYCGTDFGQPFSPDWPILWAAVEGDWHSAAERYRQWFEAHLPQRAKKILENPALPAWYEDAPLVVTYPVRGYHDTDEMSPNPLFPYKNALPLLDRIAKESESRLMVLLMHWEGTAPWAPPYVWPPFGGEEPFFAFRDALHQRGHSLGVYCSGFGWTEKSNLTDYRGGDPALHQDAFCADEQGKAQISKICTAQRSGYDICPASPKGKALLKEAYSPLFECGIDYAQILDQNHGGGQYFCLSPHHGHPPAPGPWMTEKMQELLGEWNESAPKMLFGCESAAAEPFIGNLLFSDNRFELNFKFGRAVPLYSYLYHEYLRNFMGNQVACPFLAEEDTLRWRMAYSFAAGDCLTLVLSPDGQLFSHWGSREFQIRPSMEHALTLACNLSRFYREQAKPFLFAGKMIPPKPLSCKERTFPLRQGGEITLPLLHTSAWLSAKGERAQIIINPWEEPLSCKIEEQERIIPPLNAILISL